MLVGRATLEALGVKVGDRVTISIPQGLIAGETAPANPSTAALGYSIVGSAVAPAIGEPGQYTPKLGVGALLSRKALGELAAQAPAPVGLLGAFVLVAISIVQGASMFPANIASRAVVDRSVRPE